jgi:hypothetical protein
MSHAPALKRPQPAVSDSDYDNILAALMETARGRWFLQEYAARNRNADTEVLLSALSRIESAMHEKRSEATAARAVNSPQAEAIEAETIMAVHRELASVLENFIECGAPTYLCNDMARHLSLLKELVPAARAEAAPSVPMTLVLPAASSMTPERGTASELTLERRDPFAEIRALSEAEKIALFT